MQFGSWFKQVDPRWKQALDQCSDYELEGLGMEREEIEKLLKHLEELNIVI